MHELDESNWLHDQGVDLGRAVGALRASRSPPAGADARVFAALVPRLGGPPSGGDGGLSSGAGPASAAWIAKLVGATIGMTAGGLALVRVGAILVGLGGDPAGVGVRPPALSGNDGHDPSSAPAGNLDSDPSKSVVGPEPSVDAGLPVAVKPVPPSADATSSSDLEAELALLDAARLEAEPLRALTILDGHGRDFPHGSLAAERDAMRVVALCRLDRLAQARTAARSLIQSRPSSPLIDRMREGCPGLAEEFD